MAAGSGREEAAGSGREEPPGPEPEPEPEPFPAQGRWGGQEPAAQVGRGGPGSVPGGGRGC